jgi:hypothetical protein
LALKIVVMTRELLTLNWEQVLGNFTFRYLYRFFPFTYLVGFEIVGFEIVGFKIVVSWRCPMIESPQQQVTGSRQLTSDN